MCAGSVSYIIGPDNQLYLHVQGLVILVICVGPSNDSLYPGDTVCVETVPCAQGPVTGVVGCSDGRGIVVMSGTGGVWEGTE